MRHGLTEMTRQMKTAFHKFGYHSLDALLPKVDPDESVD